ncbi:tail fiber protein [Bradyrhizobium sp. PMVTL-01]|uniref:tail fiber protein n=1 Tax=Bradyrhizobium sp. PMVTL-01 TaxID=3434999 RepID=UPI003F6EC53A
MADPTGYEPGYSFSGFQASNPTTPLPAAKVDDELANIGESNASIVSAIKDVRRADGALKNGIVTYESLTLALQLIFDPTNGEAVANAVAAAQAAASAASSSATTAGTSATSAANSAAAAAASASSVNLSLYLSKAGNLAGLGNNDTALANLTAMKRDGTNGTGRLGPNGAWDVGDWNNQLANGIYSSAPGASNAPDSTNYWLVQVLTADVNQRWVTQIAYQFVGAQTSADSVLVYKRFAYDNGGVRTWTPWISNSAVPVGTVVYFPSSVPPPGWLKLYGSLLSRTSYAGLWNYANTTGNLVSETTWATANFQGAFSTGDLSTTFRIPDGRGEFLRGWDDSRGVDPGRQIGSLQGDLIRDHTHNYDKLQGGLHQDGTQSATVNTTYNTVASGSVNGGLGGSETRPRNIALLACIKY